MWYQKNQLELEKSLDKFFSEKIKLPNKKLNGIIVPHAGYVYSGEVAGKAYSILNKLKNKPKRAIIIGPSHYIDSTTPYAHYSDYWFTPLGKIKTFNIGFETRDLTKEHSIDNQIPFLQKIGIKEIMPLMIGDINDEMAKKIGEKILKFPEPILLIISTDLSHFLPYDTANEIDQESIEIIEKLDKKRFNRIDACGINPIKILFNLCEKLKTKPVLIEYKNSGDITKEKTTVVGYASFYF